MLQSFRLTMTWLHTWFGLVLGFVLMVVFLFGSLSVFDREIDRWANPTTRFAPQPMPSFDRILAPAFARLTQPDADDMATIADRINGPMPTQWKVMDWSAYTTHRDPVLRIFSSFALPNPKIPDDHVHGHVTLDPRDGRVLPADDLKVGSEFFYPMHIGLNFTWNNVGYWIVGLAALAMLAALVSGVVMHRKIFAELFTFRPNKQTRRSLLDLHNLTGVVALPFHFMFALSGLIIFATTIYFPVEQGMLKPLHDKAHEEEAKRTGLHAKPAGIAAPLGSVDAMVAEAQRRWAARGMAGEVGFLFINHVGDANATVSIYRAGTDRVSLTGEGIHFSGVSGAVIREEPPHAPAQSVANFVTGLHLQHFRHGLLRWLYLVGGLAGCACIATGFIFFVEKRKRQHAAQGVAGSRIVDALAVATVTGALVATLAMLVANRALPEGLAQRDQWQMWIFFGTWAATLLHAWWRTAPVAQAKLAPAWAEQCVAIAVLGVAAPLLNALTTGDHLFKTIAAAYWPVAGVDAMMLVTAACAGYAALRLRRRAARVSAPLASPTNPVAA